MKFCAIVGAAGLSVLVTPAVAVLRGRAAAHSDFVALPEGCGAAPKYENSRPKNYKDARPTFYNTETKKTEPVVFKGGDSIDFECEPGFSIDGSKDGSREYQVECSPNGYYEPKGVCLPASKCGAIPNVTHAISTGKIVRGAAEYACTSGYSLDGKKVVAGGLGKNRLFKLQCVEFSGAYEEFKGECKPYAFAASKETTRLYNKVGEALFIVSCKGSLKTAFADKKWSSTDKVCDGFGDQSDACRTLVTKIETDFESELKAREDFDKEAGKDWHETKDDPARPGIEDEANTFCTELWKLLEMP